MFNSKEEAVEWINFILDKHASRKSSFPPLMAGRLGVSFLDAKYEGTGEFYKLRLDSKNILIDEERVLDDELALKLKHIIGVNPIKNQYIIPFGNLQKVSIIYKKRTWIN